MVKKGELNKKRPGKGGPGLFLGTFQMDRGGPFENLFIDDFFLITLLNKFSAKNFFFSTILSEVCNSFFICRKNEHILNSLA
jgi:hypothetical protein